MIHRDYQHFNIQQSEHRGKRCCIQSVCPTACSNNCVWVICVLWSLRELSFLLSPYLLKIGRP
jgi:hypothetical protein